MIETRFKETMVGKFPKDWDVRPLGEIGTFSKGAGISREEALSGKLPAIRYGELYTTHNDYIKKFQSFISENVAEASAQINYGDVLFAASGETKEEIGKCVAFIGKEEAYAGGDIIILHTNTDEFDAKFCGYALNTQYVVRQKSQRGQGDAVVHIVPRDLASIIFSFPKEKSEQTRIATTLSSIDNLISELEKLIEKKRAIKQGAMQQLLTGKRRLKGFSEPWVEKTIREIGNLTGAGVDKKNREGERPVRLVNYLDVFHRDFIYNRELDFWTTANDSKTLQCNVLKGDVFFTPSSEMPYDIAISAVAMEDMKNVCYSYHIYRLRFEEDVDLKYKAYMFKTLAFYDQANTTCEGSGKRYVISLSKFRKLKVRYPSDIKEQSAIASILSTMDDEIAKLKAKRDKYIAIKQGMMQQLLTGKIRLI